MPLVELNPEDADTQGLEELSTRLIGVTERFCNRVVGRELDDNNFHINHGQYSKEFEDCVKMLPVLDELAELLSSQVDMVNVKSICTRCVGLEGNAGLENVRQGLVDLHKAVRFYHDDFLCNKYVGACAKKPLQTNAARDMDDVPDVTCQPTRKLTKVLKKEKIALERIPQNMAIILQKLTVLANIVENHIQLQSPDPSLANLSMHLSAATTPMEFKATNDEKKVFAIAQYVLNSLHLRRAHKVVPNRGQICDAKNVMIWTPIIHDHVSTGVYRNGLDEATEKDGMSLAAYVEMVLSPNPPDGMQACPDEIAVFMPWNSAEKVAKFICRQADSRFPHDDPNPHLIAFTNGVLNTLTATFHPHGGSNECADAAQVNPLEVTDKDLEMLRRMAEAHNKKIGTRASVGAYLDHGTNSQPCMFVPSCYDPEWLEMTMDELEDECSSLKTMLVHQGIPNDPVIEGEEEKRNDVRFWIYALIARAMIMFGDRFDRWQIALFFLGCAGTGKSTILDMIRKFFPPHVVKALEDEGEGTFGLMSFVRGLVRVILGSEIPTTMPMSQIAKCISHEPVSVAIKFGDPVYVNPWIAEFIFAGNGFPSKGNTAGRMSRRYVIIPFNRPVANQQSGLEKHIQENLGAYITLCVRAYNIIGRKHGAEDFFNAAPQFFRDQARKQFVQSNSLALYLSSSDFTYGAQYKTPWPIIEQAAKEYASLSGPGGRVEMVENLKEMSRINVCNSLNLKLSERPEAGYYAPTSRDYNCIWVKGIALTSSLQDQSAAAADS